MSECVAVTQVVGVDVNTDHVDAGSRGDVPVVELDPSTDVAWRFLTT